MSRRSFLVAVGIVVLLVGGLTTALLLLVQHEPEYYRRAMITQGERRTKLSQEFLSEFSEFWSALSGDRDWYARFTDEQINSYFDEAFTHCGLAEKLLPERICEPRIIFEQDRMRLAFRYRGRIFNPVVSVTLRIWLPSTETNVIALQLEGISAGLVPFTAQWLLEHISETARQNGIEVQWYRHQGHPVALLRFQADQARPTLQFKGVQFDNGSITLHGRSAESRAALPSQPRDIVLRK